MWKYHADLVPFHSVQVRNFYLLVLGQGKINLQFCNLVIIINSHSVENSVDADLDLHYFNSFVWFHTVFKGFKQVFCFSSDGLAQTFVQYLFFSMGQAKLSMDMYVMAIYVFLGKYKFLLFPNH